MHSIYQEEQKSVKIEFIEDYCENRSDPEPKVKHEEDACEQRGNVTCLFLILH